ncbi:MAG TPA: bifunctional YncE family protein/alkaline phosphatase family protein [Candidatus Sulfotelmatobacter sp.]|nr:bifunctional YncE family protein/alkaline phosphatase family protein [Candidatus Sulfotelmatobacter sp.]
MKWKLITKQIIVLAVLALVSGSVSRGQILPNTGQQITPLAPSGARFLPLNPGLSDNPEYLAGQAVTSVVSPDGKTLLVLTSGYNLVKATSGANEGSTIPGDSTQFVFVFDISQYQPVQKQVIQIPNTYNGIIFDPSGTAFYVSGGVNDNVHIFVLGANGLWAEQTGSPISLGHTDGGMGLQVSPQAAGIAITSDGNTLVVTNYYNDSISILAKSSSGWAVTHELDLRPGNGVPGGEYPFWVVIKGNSTAYVSSIRDREIVVVDILGSPSVITRISVPGQPNKMVLNGSQSTLYVAQDNTDSVGVIDTTFNLLVNNFPVTAPDGLLPLRRAKLKGNDTNSVTLSKDEKTLYVTNGAMNDVAVVQLSAPNQSWVSGLIPTGWYPSSVSLSNDGKFMYVANYKTPTGPNPGYCHGLSSAQSIQCNASNQYDLQLIKAGLQSFPTPTQAELRRLTEQVADNNNFGRRIHDDDQDKMMFLRNHIDHVIYIVKENRTYDQILGDLDVGNGDPEITQFGYAITPNLHNLASQFVDLDNFYDTSEVSMDGWPWTTSAHATDVVERQTSVEYAGRGLSYDSEGTNRNVNVGLPTLAARLASDPLVGLLPDAADVLPGTANTAAPDGPQGEQGAGFLWDGALRTGLTVRNYGYFIDLSYYNLTAAPQFNIPEDPTPFADGIVVAHETNPTLMPLTDPYFRGFDMSFPDYYRFTEWQRDFNAGVGLANLTLLRLPHDHTGNFGKLSDWTGNGVDTPELDEADNDYAVGLVVQTIAKSPYKKDTLIFVIEDDAQDGGDHVDAHRSIAFVVGPYVKQGAVVSTAYNTLSMVRTIEDILGISPLNLNDALAQPMADVFDTKQKNWTFTAVPSDYLYSTQLPLPPMQAGHHILYSTHDATYWAKVTEGMDFSVEDHLDAQRYNRILWKGLMGDKPYPSSRSGLDLRANREELLQRYRSNLQQQTEHSQDNSSQTAGSGR